MNQSFRYRYVNPIVGTFVILSTLTIVAIIVLAAISQDWLERVHTYRVILPEDVAELEEGAEVRILGTKVGSVERIDLIEELGRLQAYITVSGDINKLVRIDSVARIKRKFGIAGDAFIEVTRGQGARIQDGGILECEIDTELIELAEQLVEEAKQAVLPAIKNFGDGCKEWGDLASELRREDRPLMQFLTKLDDLALRVQDGEGMVGRLLSDPELATELESVVVKANYNLEKLSAILDHIEAATRPLPGVARRLDGELENLPGTIVQTRQAIAAAEELIEGLKKHWLLRSYMETKPRPARIPSDALIGLDYER